MVLSLPEAIRYNLNAEFEVLSDFTFLRNEIYLSCPVFGTNLRGYKPKYIRTDQDGVCEEEGTPQLSFLHFREMARRNQRLNENFEYLTGKIFNDPVEVQEKELTSLLKGCSVKIKDFVYAGQAAVRKFRPVKNLLNFVSTIQRKLGYSLETFSGVFSEAKMKVNSCRSYQGPLKIFWKRMGLSEKQINGSIAYFGKNGEIERIELRLEHRKEKPIEGFLNYLIGFTDNLKGDFPMMSVNINTTPVAILFGKSEETLHGIAVPFPEGKKDMMKTIKPILKVERGFMEYIGGIDVKEAERIGNKIKGIYKQCSEKRDPLSYKNDYVKDSLAFLNLLRFRFD
ncbi:MAG: hypothetical protein QMD12_03315, partial [Candidatus Aenigmarchaeota archaeon]|nr:hypothetical protein [Candidatus Aenigmarchaeota archaeon]